VIARDWLLEVMAHREADAFDRAIDLRITRLQRKVEVDPAHPKAIRKVRGVGYPVVPPRTWSTSSTSGFRLPMRFYHDELRAPDGSFGSRAVKLRVSTCTPHCPS
jgi:hypothetical protein